MTEAQHQKAKEIQREIEGIKSELRSWDHSGYDGAVCPLTFRMTGSDLQHTPKQAFLDFKAACITGMNKRLEDLRTEFDSL